MKILNFGSCNIDYVYSLDHIVKAGETQKSAKMNIFPGGKGLNQSVALAKAGANVFHAGKIGYDGDMLRDFLNSNGVNTEYLEKAEIKNGHAIIQVSADGENSIVLYAGSNECIDEPFIDAVLENFGAGDIILLQNEISCVPYIVNKAYEKGMTVVFNPSPYNEKIKEIDFSKISYALINEIEACQISGSDNEKTALERLICDYPNLRIVNTLGKRGCIYKDKEREIYQKAFSVKAVDTTAAGDTFTGYFVAGIAENKDISEILLVCTAASAISVTKNGAAPSIPTMAETKAFLTEKGVKL